MDGQHDHSKCPIHSKIQLDYTYIMNLFYRHPVASIGDRLTMNGNSALTPHPLQPP